MKFARLLEIVADEPLFESGLLLVGVVADVRPFVEREEELELLTRANLLGLLAKPRR